MKKVLGIIAVVFVVVCLCYGAYEEGRFQQRWENAGKFDVYVRDTLILPNIHLHLRDSSVSVQDAFTYKIPHKQ